MPMYLVDGDRPYIVAMSHGHGERKLHFHCAREGRKLEIIENNPRTCWEWNAMSSMFWHGMIASA